MCITSFIIIIILIIIISFIIIIPECIQRLIQTMNIYIYILLFLNIHVLAPPTVRIQSHWAGRTARWGGTILRRPRGGRIHGNVGLRSTGHISGQMCCGRHQRRAAVSLVIQVLQRPPALPLPDEGMSGQWASLNSYIQSHGDIRVCIVKYI